jgi:hypothetical protein
LDLSSQALAAARHNANRLNVVLERCRRILLGPLSNTTSQLNLATEKTYPPTLSQLLRDAHSPPAPLAAVNSGSFHTLPIRRFSSHAPRREKTAGLKATIAKAAAFDAQSKARWRETDTG